MTVSANPDRLLSTKEAAVYLNLSPATLNTDRCVGRMAIPYLKLGAKSVRYRVSDLEAWLKSRPGRNSN